MENPANPKMKGALLAFIVLQLCYLFFFFIRFPDSFRNALGTHYGFMDGLASWLSTLSMIGYCITCLAAVAQLAMRKHGFLLWFQVSGGIALVGNFLTYILRQISGGMRWEYGYYDGGDYYWILFIMALFWTVIWCMYFARSSRVYSYMGQESYYLRKALFTKNVKEPTPWVEPPSYVANYSQTNYAQPQRPVQPPPAPPPQPQPTYQPPYGQGQPGPYQPQAPQNQGWYMPGAQVTPAAPPQGYQPPAQGYGNSQQTPPPQP